MNHIPTPARALLAAAFILHPSSFIRAQGSLTPPGAPAATMKTLQQIEPRIDLQNAPASSVTTTNASYHFIITQPGSYYLSANVGATKTNGIQINAGGVTLDLNGFEISRTSGTGGMGIEILVIGHRSSVRNGSLKGFSHGINSNNGTRSCVFRDLSVGSCTGTGIYAGEAAILESCRVHDNGNHGITAGNGSSLNNCTATNNNGIDAISALGSSSLTNCTATNNVGTVAIIAGVSSSLTNCNATGNNVDIGIGVGSNSSLTNCSASQNSSASGTSSGFFTGGVCAISYCSAYFNDSSAATSSSTTGMGFNIGTRSTIHGCTAAYNKGSGIQADTGSTVSGCAANNNGLGTSGSGILAGNRVSITGSTTGENKTDGIRIGDGGTVSGCTSNDNGGRGILANNGCAITRNLTRNNVADGIYANFSCQIEGNNCNGDGTGAGAWGGIQVVGQANRVEGNNVTYASKAGILIVQAANVIVRNTVKGGTPNFSIVANNVYGPIVDRTAPASPAVTGNSAAGSSGTTDPLANIAF